MWWLIALAIVAIYALMMRSVKIVKPCPLCGDGFCPHTLGVTYSDLERHRIATSNPYSEERWSLHVDAFRGYD